MEVGPTEAGRVTGVSRKVAAYWREKLLDPNFHPLTHGGRRDENMAFGSLDGDVAAQVMVYAALDDEPKISFDQLVVKLRGVPGMEHTSPAWLSRTLAGWRYSWKRAVAFARQKFTGPNIQYYLEYCTRIVEYEPARVSLRNQQISTLTPPHEPFSSNPRSLFLLMRSRFGMTRLESRVLLVFVGVIDSMLTTSLPTMASGPRLS